MTQIMSAEETRSIPARLSLDLPKNWSPVHLLPILGHGHHTSHEAQMVNGYQMNTDLNAVSQFHQHLQNILSLCLSTNTAEANPLDMLLVISCKFPRTQRNEYVSFTLHKASFITYRCMQLCTYTRYYNNTHQLNCIAVQGPVS